MKEMTKIKKNHRVKAMSHLQQNRTILLYKCCTTMLYNKFCRIKHFVKTQNMLCKQVSKTQNMLAKHKACLDNNVVQL